MDLAVRHLRLVSAIAEEGSVTRAGHRLHLTQSALSHQLRDIVDVRIVAEATSRAYEALLQGELDLAIVSTPVRNRRIRLQPLFRDEFVAVLAPDHPLASRPWLAPEDLRDETLLMYSGPDDNTGYQMFLAPAGVTPRRTSQVKLTEAMVEMVKAGLGVAVMARWSVAPQIASREVRAVRLGRAGLHRQWSAATLRMGSTPAYLREFVDLLAADPTAALGAPKARPRRAPPRPQRPPAVA